MEDSQIKELEKELDNAHSFAAIKRIMDSKSDVEYITSGSARAVYKLNDDKVLKIAKNAKGIAQNEAEADWGLKNYGVASEWYDVSEKGFWIESEYCKKCTVKDFREITGRSFKSFAELLNYNHYDRNGNRYYTPTKPDDYDDSWDDDFVRCFYDYMGDFGVPVGDLTRLSSYGINHKGDIVLVDTGLNQNVYDDYYKRESKVFEEIYRMSSQG